MKGIIFEETSNVENFNSLPSLEEAEIYYFSNFNKIETFLNEASKLIYKYNLINDVGICLLHVHNYLESDKYLMLREVSNNFDDAFSIRNRVTIKKESSKLCPVSWNILCGEIDELQYQPIEWANDNKSFEAYKKLKESSFSLEFAKLLQSKNLQTVLGLTLMPFPKDYTIDNDNIYVETTIGEKLFEENIIKIERKSDYKPKELTITNWFFHKSIKYSYCKKVCLKYTFYCKSTLTGHSKKRRCILQEHRRFDS